jgi:PAS domain S-box-containing protein
MYTVLYVDDERDLLEVGKHFLEENGQFSVDIITSAQAALTLLDTKNYHAIISDYQMPRMDGIEFLKKVRSSGNHTPFILFTGRGREEIVIQALNEGADFYLQKGGEPVSQFTELAHKVRQAIQIRMSGEALRERERQLNAMAANIPGVVFRFYASPEGVSGFDYISERSRQILGLENDPVTFLDRITGGIVQEDRDRFISSIRHAISTKTPWEFNGWYVKPSGKKIWISALSSPVMENGRLIFDGVIFNSTGWKLAVDELQAACMQITASEEELRGHYEDLALSEQQIRESEKKYRTVFETTGTSTVLIENDMTISLVNTEFERLSGFPRDGIENRKKWTEFVVREDRDRMIAGHQMRRTDPERAPKQYEFRFLTRSGETRDVYVTIDVIPGTQRSVASLLDLTDQKKMAGDLKESEEKYRTLMELAPIAVVLYRDRKIVYANAESVRLAGAASADELTGKDISLFIYPEDMQLSLDHTRRILETGEILPLLEQNILTLDGKPLTVEITGKRILYQHQPSVLVVFQDMTRQKETEKALALTNNQLRLALEGAGADDWEMNLATGEFHYSDQFTSMYDYSPEEKPRTIEGVIAVIHPDDVAGCIQNLQRYIEGKTDVYESVIRFRTRDGSWGWYLSRGRATERDPSGRPTRITGVTIDITERMRAGNAVRESEEKFRSLFDNVNDHIFINELLPDDMPGKFLEVNTIMCSRLGYTRDELLTMNVGDILTDSHRKELPEISHQIARKRFHTFYGEHRRKDGSVFTVEVNSNKFTFSGREVILSVARDITERLRAENAAKLARKKLDMMETVTRHEIRNLITGILGSVDMAFSLPTEGEREMMAREIRNLIAKILREIDFTEDYEMIGINPPEWQQVEQLIPLPASLQVRVSPEIASLEVYADPLLAKIFVHLAENVARHGVHATEVAISGSRTPGGMVITFEDNGAGVPGAAKEVIFTRKEGDRKGMGLFLVREILAITGITITETGEPGKGARFEIVVPEEAFRYPPAEG